MFYAFFIGGLSLLAHEFLRGILFFYGIQLHHLSPNSLLHIACFITLCECWLGIEPHSGLFRRLYSVKRQSGTGGVYPLGGYGIYIFSTVQFFSFILASPSS